MPLHPNLAIPERILTLGPAGSGKTTNWLDIAKWAERTKSDSQFYVLDTDFAAERMLTGYADCAHRIHISVGYDWADYLEFQRMVLEKARPQDWVIIDFIGNAWVAVQQNFTEQVFNKDIGDYFLEVRKQLDKKASSLGALEGWTDWQVINPMYKKWVNPLLFKGRYNVYATAKSTQLSGGNKPTEDSQTRSLFLPYGVKPEGQKDLPYQFHTVLLTTRDGRGTRTLTSIKDRERVELKGQELNSFTLDYLKAVANWEIV